MKTTRYFDTVASINHPESQDRQRVAAVLANAIATDVQTDSRVRHWGWTLDDNDFPRIMRVVTLADGETVHNAFFDRNFERKTK